MAELISTKHHASRAVHAMNKHLFMVCAEGGGTDGRMIRSPLRDGLTSTINSLPTLVKSQNSEPGHE